jgi:hypothetical protein
MFRFAVLLLYFIQELKDIRCCFRLGNLVNAKPKKRISGRLSLSG